MSYIIYFRIQSRYWKSVIREEESRLFLLFFLGASVLITAWLSAFNAENSLEQVFFQSAATISTTGFRMVDYSAWPPLCHLVILLLMISGGCTASPAGGIKIMRLLVYFKMVGRNISRRLHPSAVLPIRINGAPISSDAANAILGHWMLYAAVVFFATLLITLSGADVLTSVGSAISCMGNVGPGLGAAGPMGDYALFNPFIKLLLSIIMILGRLEFEAIILISPQFWRNN
jgi:trk system potassium uptake protein TrkH